VCSPYLWFGKSTETITSFNRVNLPHRGPDRNSLMKGDSTER
jgi:hypothetical protein